MSAAAVRALLQRRGLLARRDLGQNFLHDESIATRLVTLAGVGPEDAVIEVGTGLGILTRALAARAARVLTLEVDAGLVRLLREEELLPPGVELRHVDALEVDLAALARGLGPRVRLVANLPYSVASPLLRRLLDAREVLVDWSVLLQKEVAERLLAPPGSPAYGSFAVLHALLARVEPLLVLPPGCFFPPPKVRSSFVRVTPLAAPLLAPGELPFVEAVVRAAFGLRRKTLLNALLGSPLGTGLGEAALRAGLVAAGLDPRVRAERVGPRELLVLARALAVAPTAPAGTA